MTSYQWWRTGVVGLLLGITLVWLTGGITPVDASDNTPSYTCGTHRDMFEGLPPERLGFPTEAEKKQAASWLRHNDFNRYGDEPGTAYAGGTPLFNEATGEFLTLYQLLVKKYPDKPWKN